MAVDTWKPSCLTKKCGPSDSALTNGEVAEMF